jgi:hypothetical protein
MKWDKLDAGFRLYVAECQSYNAKVLGDNKPLLQYHKNSKGQRTGVVIAYKGDSFGGLWIGVSLRHKKEGNPFVKDVAITKALLNSIPIENLSASKALCERKLFTCSSSWRRIPLSMRKEVEQMTCRAYKYFKEASQVKPENTEGLVELSTSDISSFAMNKAQP